jgi:CO/xanthine dehydrogenase Mo-binding subunit
MSALNDIKTKSRTNLGRRGFLQASGGLFVAFNLFGDAEAVSASQPIGSVQAPPPEGKLYAWLAVHPDNTATLFTGKVDVGTGTKTALAQIAAEELDISVDRLAVVMGNTSETVDQGPSYGSRTVRYAGPQIRQAAAAGRAVLLDLAADHFKAKANSLSVKDGVISDLSSQSISYGDLVAGKQLDMTIGATGTSFAMKVAPQAKAKDPKDYTIIGQSVARKDIPGKITADFNYIQDVKVPGMLHGRVVRPYGVQAKLESVDESAVKGIPGFVKLVRRDNFLGVVCETEWAAIQAAAKLGSVLHPKGPDAYAAKWSKWDGLPQMDKIWDVVRDTPGTTAVVANKGSVDQAMAVAKKTLKATFRTPFQMHGSIGPSCAVADVGKEQAIFWSGTQMPHEARRDMAKLLGMKPEQIELRWFEAAGAYGRNGLEHAIADAALMSQSVGKPVRVQWMRWDEHGWEPKGPPITQDLEAAIDDNGNITAWRHKMWIPTFLDNTLIAAQLIGRPDIVGAVGHGLPAIAYAYQFENADVACHGDGRVALRTAWLRSPAQYETTFAMETFIDELAAETGQDPLAFRLKYLKDQRAIDVLKAAAKQYGWAPRPARGQAPQAGKPVKGRGIAWVNRDDSRVATIADVTVDPSNGTIKVDRVVVAHDCGLVVNPNGLRNQVEGNVIQSISRTLHEEVTFDHSHVTSRDWIGYPILRFKEVPDSIEVVIVNNDPKYPMHGAGEPSTCPTAAVISSAVYDAVGIRLRDLPFRPNKLKAALSQA